MSNTGERLRELSELGITLFVDGEQLRARGSRELMTEDILHELKTQKQQFVEHLRQADIAVNAPITSVSRSSEMPLSYSQQRLWFLDQFDGASSLYNITLAARFSGPIKKTVLEDSLRKIVDRHEVLRTQIHAGTEGEPIQQICDVALTLSHIRVEADEADHDSQLEALCSREFGTAFNLAEPLKIRAALIEFSSRKDEHVLLVTMHHIASDGWSVDVFVQELQELYNASLENRPSQLPNLAIQYADYSSWLIKWLNGPRLIEQTAYWRKQLADAPALIGLPTDHPRPLMQSYAGRSHEFTVSEATTKGLRALGASRGVTLYMTLLSAFNVLLSRYSGERGYFGGLAYCKPVA